MKNFPQLPVYHKLDEITSALDSSHSALISAEPGAGKTMLVPVLVNEYSPGGMTILVEPRRIAARSAAYGIANLHDLEVGKETGFAVRGESCRCHRSGILAVTPGIMLQMLQHDPTLDGVNAIIFDEFHERSADVDLALTLVLDIRDSLREDLLLLIMSATLDSQRTADFIHAPMITIPGRNFPVDISYRDTPNDLREIPRQTARAVLENLHSSSGNILVFLPGAEEIRQCQLILDNALEKNFHTHILHGSLSLAEQRSAMAAPPPGIRNIILATNVAESSLTLDNVTCVVDSGWEKRAVYHPGAKMTFLETRRITKASAIQRSGRAGRTAPGKAVRCYNRFTFEQFTDFPSPEILVSELSSLFLTIRVWGADVDSLRWLDTPPQAAIDSAAQLLRKLSLLTADLHPTAAGKQAAELPISPRLAAMMIFSPPSLRRTAARLAAILEEKDDFMRFNTADLRERLAKLDANRHNDHIRQSVIARLLKEFPPAPPQNDDDPGLPIAIAFPEWIARNRSNCSTTFQLANGSAATLRDDDFLRKEEFLAVARIDGSNSVNPPIRLAIPIDRNTIEKFFAGQISERQITTFDSNAGKPVAFTEKCLGDLPLSRHSSAVPRADIIPALLKEAARRTIPLPPADQKRAVSLLQRLRFAKSCGMDQLPNMTDEYGFFISISDFFPDNINTLNDLRKTDWFNILNSAIDYPTMTELNRLCPEFFIAPSGHKFPIDYSASQPTAGIIIQELYTVNTHPTVGKNRIPLRIELLSPARRPVQVTSDLPGFWAGSWELVRAEMRSRYPKHSWPLLSFHEKRK
ncbi:MAG: ATP-dependent helicase HrpB [Lentisphaerae bacterium]|nr:ATP-dependent helicase HrpB [Lentisphaerota bacterium]